MLPRDWDWGPSSQGTGTITPTACTWQADLGDDSRLSTHPCGGAETRHPEADSQTGSAHTTLIPTLGTPPGVGENLTPGAAPDRPGVLAQVEVLQCE